MRIIIGILMAIGLMAGVASATLLLSVDSTTNTVGGSTITVEATELGGSFPNTGGRWASVTNIGTDVTATVPAVPPKTDFYFQWSQFASLGMLATNYHYAEIHYSLSDDWVGTVQKCRLGDTVSVTATSGDVDDFSNPELFTSELGYTAGTHKFVVDLTTDKTYDGDWRYLRWNMFNGDAGDANKSVTIDKIIFGTAVGDFHDVYYVAGAPTDWTDGTAWSDSLPANGDGLYYVTNGVVLETPTSTATFPGSALSLVSSQRMEVMTAGADVITIDPLTLISSEVAAGDVGAGEARLDGTIAVLANSKISGATNDTRDVRILAEVSGGAMIELSAPTKTIYIDNAANTYGGTWVVVGGTTEFTAPGAVGLADIDVQSNGTLRIIGAWDGRTLGSTLTVADSPSADVDLGSYAWTIGALDIGGVSVPNGTYTIAELNALAVNPVFSGTSGTMDVGFAPKTYYLQANSGLTTPITTKSIWYDAPTGGSPMPDAAPFAGSTFDVNDFNWATENEGSAIAFEGLLAHTTGDTTAALYGGNARLEGGMYMTNRYCFLRAQRVSGAGFYVSDMQLYAPGRIHTRCLVNAGKDYFIENISFGTIQGDGDFWFGRSGTGGNLLDTNGVWSLTVEERSTNYTGRIRAMKGEVTLANEMVLDNAQLYVGTTPGEDNGSVVLSTNVIFGSLQYEGAPLLTNGVHTAGDLNTLFSTTVFSGPGTLSFEVIAVPLVAPVFTDISVSGADLVLSGTSSNINANGEYRLQATPSLTIPSWMPISTNLFDSNGDFSVTNTIPGANEEFYRLEVN